MSVRLGTSLRRQRKMNPFDFTFIVLPLGIMVFLLVAGIMLIVKRSELAKERKIRRINSVLKEKARQHELAEKQLNELKTMYTNRSINADTYSRLQTLIKMHTEKQEETEAELIKIWDG
jgi:hypothetical protein